MTHLSIDIETFSSVDIKKSGLYKYVQAPDFEVMLLAYAYGADPITVVDLKQGQRLPERVISDMFSPDNIKHAYNAAFEWYCLSKHFGLDETQCRAWLSQWRCTMLHGLYCGFTIGLAATGEAVGLPTDRRKFSTGGALIRTFCVPQEPKKANGFRTRTLPGHEPERWELFKSYCAQDVVTEREIQFKLSQFPVPDDIQRQWELDQIINEFGVMVDMDLVKGAVACDSTVTSRLTNEAEELTGLQNPNSCAQLLRWFQETLPEEDITDLQKDTIKTLLKSDIDNADAKRMLELRKQLSKSSTAKYTSMSEAVCGDGRIRGSLQFYGANRTGRWAGRIIQPQNLPRTKLASIPLARNLVKRQSVDTLKMLYGDVPNMLSQLIRTAIVAPEGKLLISADFSAIEARVIAWLAGEEWVLDVFRTHGKIYEATASQMFGVPIELIVKGKPEYELRQKGKVATLALGYQGSTGALIKMHALEQGLTEEELPGIVKRWRTANPRIVDLWYSCERAAVQAVQGRPAVTHGITFMREMDATHGLDFLTITLPSRRKLYYASPHMGVNKWGKPSVSYYGMNQTTKKWGVSDLYGGRIVENIVQAIARDCLTESIERLASVGYQICFHVHDEIICEVNRVTADDELRRVCSIMGQSITWAPGLPLSAEGYASPYYKKD